MRAALAISLALLTGCGAASAPTPAAAPTRAHDANPPAPPSTSAVASPPRPPQVRATTVMHLPTGVSRAVAVADPSRVLVLGGLAPGDSTTGRVWSLDLAGRSARTAGALTTPVHDSCGALISGHPFVFG
ncbi:MAG TPA: hypothetical protein VKJ07_04520, partial [Mycobacteriales bacterium]|nr:hypothetical protein [Mycobacteriales bacterium]